MLISCVGHSCLRGKSRSLRTLYSRTPLIRTLVIRVASYPNRLGPSGEHFRTLIVLHLLWLKFFPNCQIHIRNYVLIFYLYVNKYLVQSSRLQKFFPLQNVNIAYFQKKNPLIRILCISGWLAVPINPDKCSLLLRLGPINADTLVIFNNENTSSSIYTYTTSSTTNSNTNSINNNNNNVSCCQMCINYESSFLQTWVYSGAISRMYGWCNGEDRAGLLHLGHFSFCLDI